ncbi:MAG: PHP domain-containing protein [Thermoplasmata archaeon]
MDLPLTDFHIHSNLSDGSVSVDEIINFADKHGFEMIGISDHYETSKTRSIKSKYLKNYIDGIRMISKKFNIPVKVGIEIDFSHRTNFDEMNFDIINQLDYALFEYVQDPVWDGKPFWEFLEVYDKFEIPVGLAHNNIDKNFKDVDYDNFLNTLESTGIFVEMNTNPIYSMFSQQYFELSMSFFESIKGRNIPISIGSDMHFYTNDMLNIKKAISFIIDLGIENNYILFLKYFKK